MQNPKDVPIWEYAPDRRLAQFTVRLRNVTGALAQVSKLVADLGVIVMGGFTSAPSDSRMGVWSFFADITESTDLARVRRALLDLTVVEGVEVLSSEDGFMVDRQNFPLMFSKRRALIMRTDALNGMFARLWDVFGSGAVAIVDQMAEAMGKYTANEILDDLGREQAVRSLDEILGTYTALGYAQVEIGSRDEDSMSIRARGLFECESNAKRDIRRKSTFFRAHLRGLMSTIFNSDYEVTEVECLAEGDEACSFTISKTPTLASRLPLRHGF
ncbi:MAG TPA: V4R domain-containing protein [Nitrososphaerales archaeon]|nr:V4R domain-containing protein [Nitrososphaerales archaeon]